MQTPNDFLNYLDDIMNILLQAKNIAITHPSDDMSFDEDSEYLKNLRLALLETFTSIGFGIQDVNKPLLFANYVPHIFEFMKTISANEYEPNQDILKNILTFAADMINLYGPDIKGLIQQEFLEINLNKLKQTRSKKLEGTIKWVEEVSNFLNHLGI